MATMRKHSARWRNYCLRLNSHGPGFLACRDSEGSYRAIIRGRPESLPQLNAEFLDDLIPSALSLEHMLNHFPRCSVTATCRRAVTSRGLHFCHGVRDGEWVATAKHGRQIDQVVAHVCHFLHPHASLLAK